MLRAHNIARIVGLAMIMMASCTERPAAIMPTTVEARVSSALREVLGRRGVDSPFAIIESAPSGKFVQFTGSAEDPLVLDLPVKTLSPEELARAQALFRELGGSASENGFQLTLARDSDEGARVALRVIREVYSLPDNADITVRVE